MDNNLTDLEKEAEEYANKYFLKLELEDKADILFTGMKTGVMPRQNRERLAQAEGYKDCYMEIKQQVIKGKIEVLDEALSYANEMNDTETACYIFTRIQRYKVELKQLETTKI